MKRQPKAGERIEIIPHACNDLPVGSKGTVLENDMTPWCKMDDEKFNTEHVVGLGYCAVLDHKELRAIK